MPILHVPTQAEIDAARGACRRMMWDPLVTRLSEDWLRATGAGLSFRIQEPWQARAEQMMTCATLGLEDPNNPIHVGGDLRAMFPADEWSDEVIKLAVAAKVFVATPYMWKSEMEEAADAFELPPHIITAAALREPAMYWTWEAAHGTDEDGYMDWMAIFGGPTGFLVTWVWSSTLRREQTTSSHLEGIFVPFGYRWPDQIHPSIHAGLSVTLKRFAFLNSPYVDATETRTPRHVRRDLERRGTPVSVDTDLVRVVSLRERPKRSNMRAGSSEPSGREYHHRWWVRPHSRVMHKGTDQEHVAAIPRHWKGPEGAPWITKVYAVNR